MDLLQICYLHPGVKGMQIRHLPPLLRFIPQFAQICIVFALSKFEAKTHDGVFDNDKFEQKRHSLYLNIL